MTHPNFQTNGASLEDCHTNFFALTELSGIKWRKLVWSETNTTNNHLQQQQHHHQNNLGLHHHHNHNNGGGPATHREPLEDPVLRSYARCLAADILCVWRRVPTPRHVDNMFDIGPPPPTQPPALSLHASKELWIFWYGEEPELSDLIAPELNISDGGEQGSWESGLSYECRSLLFKALHNLIERCLLSRNFIRLGKWFVQPYEGPKKTANSPPASPSTPPASNVPEAAAQPSPGTNEDGGGGGGGSSPHLSFSFAFFVHGDSSVCASIDTRQHPPVRRLSRLHVQQALASGAGLKVILAPFGLAGTLTGNSFKGPDAASARLLDDWSHFYPLEKGGGGAGGGGGGDGTVVEVIVGGMKMRYPASYVLVTDLDDQSNATALLATPPPTTSATSDVKAAKLASDAMDSKAAEPIVMHTPPPSPVQINSRVPQPGPYSVSVEHLATMSRDPTAATVLPERTWQDCLLNGGGSNNTANNTTSGVGGGGGGGEFNGSWDFVEPTRKINCTCSKCRKYLGANIGSAKWLSGMLSSSTSTSSSTTSSSSVFSPTVAGGNAPLRANASASSKLIRAGAGGVSSSNSSSSSTSGRVPFHKRSPLGILQATPAPRQATATSTNSSTAGGAAAAPPTDGGNNRCGGGTGSNAGSYTPSQQGGPPSYPRTQESMACPSVGSPASVAPSPLPPNSHSAPTSVPPADQMPTLSPHLAAGSAKNSPMPYAGVGGVASVKQPLSSPNDLPPSCNDSVDSAVNNSPEAPPSSADNAEGKGHASNAISGATSAVVALKRPILTSKEYEVVLGEEEQPLDMLYDYRTMDAWLNHPVKRFKPDGKENQRLNARLAAKMDIYSLYNGNAMCGDVKQELKSEMDSGGEVFVHQSGQKRPGDPYEFEEDGGSAAAPSIAMDGFKRGQQATPTAPLANSGVGGVATPPTAANTGAPPANVVVKEEVKDAKKLADNLFTNEGLQPSYKDLDQIFDNSEYTSSDEAIQVQTPPTSVHHDGDKRFGSGLSGGGGGGTTTCPTSGGAANTGILRPEELSKMFPTPPSMEHNPIASPCGQLDLPPPDYTDLVGGMGIRVKQEIYPNMGSPPEENIEDWSYVFKPPTICKMVGSSKYAPLTNLPSQLLPPVTVPPHCVYKPSWLVQQQQQQQQNVEKSSIVAPSATVALPVARPQTPLQASSGAFPPSPMQGPNFRPPPPPYELPSPASNSYLKSGSAEPAVSAPVPPPPSSSLLGRGVPEGSALALNILLTDTAFNIFRDHNFDSCTLCVCNAAGRVVGNIRGADAGVYLLNTPSDRAHASNPFPAAQLANPPPYGGDIFNFGANNSDDESIRCQCGFSAVVNRRLAHGSGLFYEDEMEITGVAEDPGERKKASLYAFLTHNNNNNNSSVKSEIDKEQLDAIPHALLELVREQCVFIPSTANAICRAARYTRSTAKIDCAAPNLNLLEFADSNDVTAIALDQSRHYLEKGAVGRHAAAVHRWPYLRASGPQCNQDIVRVMKALQPLLQEAIQKKCQTRLWEAPSAVKGPLTWRQFHRLAGRGTDDRCEPQPIPSVIVGHDKDWLSLSPYALQHWETLLLEPYSYARDVAYIVVAPDNDAILPRVRAFFKELSTAYEMCKLGRHSPITKALRDGILRVGKTAKAKIGNEPVEEWFTHLGDSETSDMLKLYAQVCKHHLAPHLQQVPMDKTLLDPPQESGDRQSGNAPPMPPPAASETGIGSGGSAATSGNSQQALTPDKAPSTPKNEQDGSESKDGAPNGGASSTSDSQHDDDDREAPSIVIYLVEPFTLGSDQPELQRLACLALLRCFQSVVAAVPDNIRSNISVQIISLESIVELNKSRDRIRHSDHMRALALNIFSQCRRLLVHSNNVKSLTGFGTAAMADLFLKSKDDKNRAPYKLYTPPYILAPMREKVEAIESFGKAAGEQASVLYLSYCLSDDQSWLLAVATDERGEIFERIIINIDIPNRSRRKKASARRVGLEKLMDFIVGVMSQSVRPWRLVVGRLGRIGHGELKGWSHLLGRKNLLKASKHLKEICSQCSMMYPNAVPCILSACLVSLEPDSVLRLMPDQFTPDERFSQVSVNSQLSTPADVSCTHILVFPTSATTQSSQTAFQEQHITPELGDDELFKALGDDMPEGIDGMNDFSDIFNWTDPSAGGGQSPSGSPRREESGPGSPGCGANNGRQGSPSFMGGATMKGGEPSEEVGTVLQQPLALGYLVSTAPTGRMPKWFWAACPHLEGVCPAFLKNALHLHSPNVQQSSDDLFQQSQVTSHPLDSTFTTDVLRYVLEGYNALSWLALDSNTRDRLSCLPVHMQVLVQLYHTTSALL